MNNNHLIFILIFLIWLLIGVKGVAGSKENRVHWEMIIFMLFAPFLGLIGNCLL